MTIPPKKNPSKHPSIEETRSPQFCQAAIHHDLLRSGHLDAIVKITYTQLQGMCTLATVGGDHGQS